MVKVPLLEIAFRDIIDWVTYDRLLDSESAGAYQDESMYEANDLYSLSKASRSTVKILPSTTRIWVSSNTRLAKESLERLIILANGTVSTSLNDADVVISNRAIDCDKDVIKEEWLFDCVENWRCKYPMISSGKTCLRWLTLLCIKTYLCTDTDRRPSCVKYIPLQPFFLNHYFLHICYDNKENGLQRHIFTDSPLEVQGVCSNFPI